MNRSQKRLRKEVFGLLVTSTLLTAVLALGIFVALRMLPIIRQQRIDTALSSGDVDRAKELAEALNAEDQALVVQRSNYISAVALEEQGKYHEAAAIFAEAAGYEDSSERHNICEYKYAEQLQNEQRWDEAEDVFRSLGGYSDAADRISECRYNKAVLLIESGEKLEGAKILDEISGMPEADELLIQTVMELTGLNKDKALAAFYGLSEEQLEQLSNLDELRKSAPKGIIDVGFYHTVGLGADGKVYACGDNTYGQCDTSEWTDAIAVSAGAYHTVALMADGTVIATGRNSEKQCEVSDWQNVIQVAANDYSTFALCADGTVIHTDYLDYSEVDTWSNITDIYTGSYSIAGKRSDGSIWVYPEMLGSDVLQGVETIALNTGYAAAISKSGEVLLTTGAVTNFSNVISISASGTVVLALELGGFVEGHFFRQRDVIDFSSIIDAVAIAAGGTHYAVVYSDGSVEVFGESDHGQTETDSWVLAISR